MVKGTGLKAICEREGVAVMSLYRYIKADPSRGLLSDEEKVRSFKAFRQNKEQIFAESLIGRAKAAGYDPEQVRRYVRRHPELQGCADADIIEAYKAHREKDSLKSRCDARGVSYPAVGNFSRKHADLCEGKSYDAMIDCYFEYMDGYGGVRRACEKYGLSPTTLRKYRDSHPEWTDKTAEELASLYERDRTSNIKGRAANPESLKGLCISQGYDDRFYYGVQRYRKNHRTEGFTDLDYIRAYAESLGKRPEEQFADVCARYGVEASKVNNYLYKAGLDVPRMSYDERVQAYIGRPRLKTLAELCRKNGIPYASAVDYRSAHPELGNLSDEDFIKAYMEVRSGKQSHSDLKELCERYGIDFVRARGYQKYHSNIPAVDVIRFYRPDLRVNIFGEIIEERS